MSTAYYKMTRINIITEALSQTGRIDLTSNARLWLNLFLEKVYRSQDWNWLCVDSGIVALTNGGAVPTGYLKLRSANLLYQGQVQREIVAMGSDEYQAYRRRGTVSGQPQRVYIDQNLVTASKTFNFWPTPDTSYTWQYFAFIMPQLPDASDNSGDALIPIWDMHDEVLIRAIQLKSLYYQDDNRYGAEEKVLIDELVAGKMNTFDNQAGNNQLKLGKKFRRRW